MIWCIMRGLTRCTLWKRLWDWKVVRSSHIQLEVTSCIQSYALFGDFGKCPKRDVLFWPTIRGRARPKMSPRKNRSHCGTNLEIMFWRQVCFYLCCLAGEGWGMMVSIIKAGLSLNGGPQYSNAASSISGPFYSAHLLPAARADASFRSSI